MPVLTMVDILRIQEFIFSSNRLQHVVGGSEMINKVLELKFGNMDQFPLNPDRFLVSAGGNLLLRFDSPDQAHNFAAEFTYNLTGYISTLETVIEHQPYHEGSLAEAVLGIQKKMQVAKTRRVPGIPLINLGVVEACYETGLPAEEFDEDGRPIAKSVHKRVNLAKASDQWDRYLPPGPQDLGGESPVTLRFPKDLDHLGRTHGKNSLVGIVFVDGNSIGQRITDWVRECANKKMDDGIFCAEFQRMSRALNNSMNDVIEELIDRVRRNINWDKERRRYVLNGRYGEFELYSNKSNDILSLPFRPIINGGDDLTFICDGRIALDLAVTAIESFGSRQIPGLGNVSACAGVNIVHSHTPVIRAYRLAEELCNNAKKRIRTLEEKSISLQGAEAAIDWHIARTGTLESLEDIRKRQYERHYPEAFTLTLRPYILGEPTVPKPGTWYWLRDEVLGGQGFLSPAWQKRWNKVKRLPELAKAGETKLRNTLSAWNITLPGEIDSRFRNSGFLARRWIDNKCTPLLDAVEIADLFFILDPQATTGGDTV